MSPTNISPSNWSIQAKPKLHRLQGYPLGVEFHEVRRKLWKADWYKQFSQYNSSCLRLFGLYAKLWIVIAITKKQWVIGRSQNSSRFDKSRAMTIFILTTRKVVIKRSGKTHCSEWKREYLYQEKAQRRVAFRVTKWYETTGKACL
jgi:hypothetical protein